MADIEIKIKGLDKLMKKFKQSPLIVGKRLSEAITRSTLLLVRELKTGGIVPVRTGQLKQSIRPEIKPLKSTIAPHTNYAIFVHEGTRYMRARPFLKHAVERKQRQVQQEFDYAAEQVIKDLIR